VLSRTAFADTRCQTARPMADLVDRVRAELQGRIDELRPLVREAASLEAALAALGDAKGSRPTRRRATRPRRQAAANPPGRSQTARGQTRQQVIEYVSAHPESTAGDVAKALGLNRNSVATRLAQLAKSGELSKAARGYTAP
jgi:CRP-like cAMP-binding protein